MLDKDLFKNEIRKLNDSSYEEFEGFPNSCSLATKKWAETFFLYAEEIVLPSATIELAKISASIVLLDICSASSFNQSVEIFTNAIIKFAEEIIPGISLISSGTWTGVMPIYDLNLFPIFIKAQNGGSAYDFADELSNAVDDWFKTGTSINTISGVTINWS
jgi:hypothetical protein